MRKQARKDGKFGSHEPTIELRAQVSALSAFGMRHEAIAAHVGCDDKTLRKHYRDELSSGKDQANAKVAKALYEQAIGGNTVAMIFWLKTQAGWREKSDVDHSGTVEIRIVRE